MTKQNKIEAVIFDWAGTTVDYGCFAPVQAFAEGFKVYGIEPTMEEVRKPMGMLKIDHIRTMMQMERISKLWEEKYNRPWTEADVEAIYLESERGILAILPGFGEVKPGVLDTVATLRSQGIKIGSTTGYTEEMMEIVVPVAKANGYAPDTYVSPTQVDNVGRPYPYMIFENMKRLGVSSVGNVVKVGDTISDIKEGLQAGVITIGLVEGSSLMGMTEAEFEALTAEEKEIAREKVSNAYKEAGAHYIVNEFKDIVEIILGC